MCSGDTQLEFDLLMISAFSIFLISASAILILSGASHRSLANFGKKNIMCESFVSKGLGM
jgi:hypothetical protein